MALIVHFHPRGMDQQKYAEVLHRLEAAGAGSPPGRLHHACYGDKAALRVTDVYDTPQNFDRFGQTLAPILTALGIELGKPDVIEVHNIIRG
ncbi:MAG TPA: hypothetical protein VGI10_15660 [Polyangiaceae bacterium]|jgi:hypothetical protein